MADDAAEDFLRQVRAALAAAGRPVDPALEQARRVLEWLQVAEVDEPEAGTDEDDASDGEKAAG